MSKLAQECWSHTHNAFKREQKQFKSGEVTKRITKTIIDIGVKSVLEIGCGRTCRADHPSIRYVGIDFVLDILKDMKELHRGKDIECINADARHLPIRDRAVDCVMTIAVIQHVGEKQITQKEERKRAQREIVRVSDRYIFHAEAHWKELIEISKPEFKLKTVLHEKGGIMLLERVTEGKKGGFICLRKKF